jgi:hypothetical protein
MSNISLDSVLGMLNHPFNSSDVDVTVNLFVASKNGRLKKIDLSQHLGKIEKWAKDNRFVAVVENGNQVFAWASPQIVASLKQQGELKIEGKQITYQELSDDDSEKMSVVAMEALNLVEDSEKDETTQAKSSSDETTKSFVREYLAKISTTSLPKTLLIDSLIYQMANIQGKQVLKFLQQMQEIRNEQERRKKEDEIRNEAKAMDRKHEILTGEILKEEIKKNELKFQIKRLSS